MYPNSKLRRTAGLCGADEHGFLEFTFWDVKSWLIPLRPVLCVRLVGFFGIVISMLLSLSGCASKPRLSLTATPGHVIVDVQTLGEYPTTVRRVRLADDAGRTIWEITSKRGTPQIHKLAFAVGANSAKLASPDSGEYEVIAPTDAGDFQLKSGTDYTVQVWGGSEHGRFAQASFRLQSVK